MRKNLFITFEGTDGSGKSTQISLLHQYFLEHEMAVVVTREPGGTTLCEKIRALIIDPENTMHPHTEALLYAASRAEHVAAIIRPALVQGKIVLCDRFLDSSLVYQGIARGLGIEAVQVINHFATDGLEPDLTFFLDITPETALKRRKEVSILDRIEMEQIGFHNLVYDGYKELEKRYTNRIHNIDAGQSPEEMHRQIVEIIQKLVSNKEGSLMI